MSDTEFATEFVLTIPAHLWRRAMTMCKDRGLGPNSKRTADEAVELLILDLIAEARR